MKRARLLCALLLTLCLGHAVATAADAYPSRPLRIIVPYQPGQGTDVATRFLSEYLARELHQSIIVENRPGAGGNIGASEAARAAPDGYTLLMGTNGTHVLNPFLYSTLPFDADRDFEAVMLVSAFPMVLLVPPASPYESLQDLLEASRARPDSVNVGLPSTTARLVLELLQQQTGTRIAGIPYKGSSTSMTDLIGGRVALAIDTVSASRAFIDSGKLKALGVTSIKPSALLPGVPTVASQGLAQFQVIAWNGMYVPRGTPPEIVQKLNAALAGVLRQPEVRRRLLELGHEPAGGTPGELDEFARSERSKWGPLIRAAGLKAD
ncbi:Bug family tripartite tricarboxylate transporter substrate binding protein [Bordetella sp. 2513F-2]